LTSTADCSHRTTQFFFIPSFSLQCSRAHRDLHSFPTRRSSDLTTSRPPERAWRCCRARLARTGNRPGRVSWRCGRPGNAARWVRDRKSTRLNSSHLGISYAVFCLKKKKKKKKEQRTHKEKQIC